jgi:hypothetical protein
VPSATARRYSIPAAAGATRCSSRGLHPGDRKDHKTARRRAGGGFLPEARRRSGGRARGRPPLHTAARYGVSQALLDAVARSKKKMMCEVVARSMGQPCPTR